MGPKHHHKSKDKERASSSGQSHSQLPTAWSEWVKYPNNDGRYYRWRTGTNGQTEYDDYNGETPRFIPAESSSSATENYTQNTTYDYRAPADGYDTRQEQPQVDTLTSTLAGTSLGHSSGYSTSRTASTDYAAPITASSGSGTNTIGTSHSSYSTPSYSTNTSGYRQQVGQSGYAQFPTPAAAQNTPYFPTPIHNTSTTSPYYPNPMSTSFAGPSGPYPSDNDNFQNSNAYHGGASENVTPRLITGTGKKNEFESRDPKFKTHKSQDFKRGTVFKVLWTEPRGENSYSGDTTKTFVTEQPHEIGRDTFYTKIRRFVVIRVGQGYSHCVPILTYQHQATLKTGVKAGEHAVVYVRGTSVPHVDGEQQLPNTPIEITVNTAREKLDKASRIHYAKTYTVEHNVKVNIIGNVSSNSRSAFSRDLERIQNTLRDNFE